MITSKERFVSTINRQIPDRVPLSFAGINEGIDSRLKSHFGLAPDNNEGLLQALGVDCRRIEAPYIGPILHQPLPGRNVCPQWGRRTRWIANDSGGYWDYCDFPLQHATVEQIQNWPIPSPDDFDYSTIWSQCEKFKEFAVIFGHAGMGDFINCTGLLRTMEQVLIDIAMEDEAGMLLFDRKCQLETAVLDRVLDAARGCIDLVWIGEDLGTQNSPILSLEMFRKQIRPRHQKLIDVANSYNVPVMIHSCGSSSWAFNDFIEMGIKVVDTLQPEAKNMSPSFLKHTYGDKLVFHGCISTAGSMAYGSVEDVSKTVRETFDIMMPGGGYIMAPTHMIQDNSPVENVIAAYQTAANYGEYS